MQHTFIFDVHTLVGVVIFSAIYTHLNCNITIVTDNTLDTNLQYNIKCERKILS